MSYQPVIIVGAARSGTNMLRDILVGLPNADTWPCDEINYIWRHGNITELTDEFTSNHVTPKIKSYIHYAFEKVAQKYQADYVVEKTCANSLRLEFVHTLFPKAKYIILVRDGRDVVASALRRWVAPFDLNYTLKKARFVPISDLPYYGIKYIRNRFYRILSDEKRVASWGPKFKEMEEVLNSHSLAEVCALQWQTSVNHTERDLTQINPTQVFRLQYEAFVHEPTLYTEQLAAFLKIEVNRAVLHRLTQDVSARSIGKWQQDLTSEQQEAVHKILQQTLQFYGYT